jgi:hypothetical protein
LSNRRFIAADGFDVDKLARERDGIHGERIAEVG